MTVVNWIPGQSSKTPSSGSSSSGVVNWIPAQSKAVTTPTAQPVKTTPIKTVQAPAKGFSIGDTIKNIGSTIAKAVESVFKPVKLESGTTLKLTTPTKTAISNIKPDLQTNTQSSATLQQIKSPEGGFKVGDIVKEVQQQQQEKNKPSLIQRIGEVALYGNTTQTFKKDKFNDFAWSSTLPANEFKKLDAKQQLGEILNSFLGSTMTSGAGSPAKGFSKSAAAIGGSISALSHYLSDPKHSVADAILKFDNVIYSIIGGKLGAEGTEPKELVGEKTPQEIIDHVVQNDLTKTPDGKAMLKTAIEAEKQGKNIQVEAKPTTPLPIEKAVGESGGVKASDANAGLYDTAKQYKTADEFVKSQQPVYHGSPVPLKKFSNKKGGAFFTDQYEDATGFAGTPDNVYEGFVNFKKPLIIDAKGAKWDQLNTKYGKSTQEIISNAQKDGYDGVTFKNIVDNAGDTAGWGGESTIHYAYKPEDAFINESQLADIWKKSRVAQPTIGEVKPVSGVAKQIEAKAVEKGMIDKGYNELAQYDSSTIKEQSQRASKYSVEDMNKIAIGEKSLPKELKVGTPLSIAEDYALKNNDSELMRKLADSPLATQISESASELSLSRMRDNNSPVKVMRNLIKTREESLKTKTGKNVKEATSDTIKDIQKEIKKKNPKKLDWAMFVKSISC